LHEEKKSRKFFLMMIDGFWNLIDSVAWGLSCVSTLPMEHSGMTTIEYRLSNHAEFTWIRFSPRSSSTRFVSFLKAVGSTVRILQ
jgi:hypothetical protein